MSNQARDKKIEALGSTFLEIGSLLMVSGASTGRIRTTITRISESFGYNTDMLISQRTLMLNIYNDEDNFLFNSLKRTATPAVNFAIVSGISKMSWLVAEQNWTVEQINTELKRLTELPHYARIWVLVLVALAGASFCRIAGGTAFDMFMVFLGSFFGIYVRQETSKMSFNPYICIYLAALTASLIAGMPAKLSEGNLHEHAFATSVLFLIPGVPLINSFSDLIDGNIQNGLIRGINGFIISFTIALGLLTTMFLYQF